MGSGEEEAYDLVIWPELSKTLLCGLSATCHTVRCLLSVACWDKVCVMEVAGTSVAVQFMQEVHSTGYLLFIIKPVCGDFTEG